MLELIADGACHFLSFLDKYYSLANKVGGYDCLENN